MNREYYLQRRQAFQPIRPELIIVAESPPISGKYFYDPAGAKTEPLFSAFMRQLGMPNAGKEEGLKAFQERGWILVDATYEPVNALSPRMRNAVILRDYPFLRDDLLAISPDKSTPLILLKANVCSLLEARLTEDGFNVLNRGEVVYFPSTGRQKDFGRQFGEIMKRVRGI